MAKRPRMGRNLDALLGGSTRERRSRPSATRPKDTAADEMAGDVAVADRDPVDKPAAATAEEPENHAAPSLELQPDLMTQASEAADAEPAPEPTPHADLIPPPVQAGDAVTDNAASDQANDHAGEPAPPAQEQAAASSPAHGSAEGTSGAPTTVTEALPATPGHETARANAAEAILGTGDRFRLLGVDLIQRGNYQPRRLFDQELLQELADSIQAEGLIQPIIVRPLGIGHDKGYELVAGERRWRAAQLAGMAEIPAIIREMPDKSVAAVSVIENIQRKDLNPLEEAAAFERLCDEFGMTHKAVAESVGRSRAAVTNLMRLLELHDEVKKRVDGGELEMGHARALLGAPREKQPALAREIIDQGLSVRAVEKRIRELGDADNKPTSRKSDTVSDPDIERLSKKLGDTLGATVRIQHKRTGRGKLEISYASVAELQGILAHIK